MHLDSVLMEATALFQIRIVPVLMNGQERGVRMVNIYLKHLL